MADASGLSTYSKNLQLGLFFGAIGSPFTAPTTYYLALTTAVPTAANTAANIAEATYTGYARVAVTNATAWTAPSSGIVSNAAEIRFGTNTATTNTITGFAIVDSASGAGNMIAFGTLASPKTYEVGDKPLFAAGALTITINNTTA